MQATQQNLIGFFEQVANKDKLLLEKLSAEDCFKLDDEKWLFSLPNLHAFLQNIDDKFKALDYNQFRNLLFSSPINQAIKQCGAEIKIEDNQGKVDKSKYILAWK